MQDIEQINKMTNAYHEFVKEWEIFQYFKKYWKVIKGLNSVDGKNVSETKHSNLMTQLTLDNIIRISVNSDVDTKKELPIFHVSFFLL